MNVAVHCRMDGPKNGHCNANFRFAKPCRLPIVREISMSTLIFRPTVDGYQWMELWLSEDVC